MTLHVGQIVDGYQILSELGRGGNGIVFKAQAGNGRMAAIKVPWTKRLQKRADTESFLRETSAAARLDHPYIARHLGVGIYRDRAAEVPYFVMELVEGVCASNLRETSIRTIVDVMCKVAEAVSYAHANRVIHCDLKPTNILIDQAGNPKVLDFGLARFLDEVHSKSGMFEGTPNYAAPEQFLGQADERTDVWTLGAILFDLLTGRPPFVSKNWDRLNDVQQLFASQEMAMNKPTPRASKWNKRVDPYLDAICEKAMRKKPSARYQTAQDLSLALKNWGRVNQDLWLRKARRSTFLSRFVPGALRARKVRRAYACLEKAIAFDTMTPPVKETLLKLLSLEGCGSDAIIVDMNLRRDTSESEWAELREYLEANWAGSEFVLPLRKFVAGVEDGGRAPVQVLLVYPRPSGRPFREVAGSMSVEDAWQLMKTLVEISLHMPGKGMPGIPEERQIFLEPLQIMPIGWAPDRSREFNARNLALLLYQALTGETFQGALDSKVPRKVFETLKAVLLGESAAQSGAEFLILLEYGMEAKKILERGLLDRTFSLPPGEYYIRQTLCIEGSGHLKIQGNTVLRFAPEAGILCHGQISARGKWDAEKATGDILFAGEDVRAGWLGIQSDAPQDRPLYFEGCAFEGGRGSESNVPERRGGTGDPEGVLAPVPKRSAGPSSGGILRMEGGALKICGARFASGSVSGEGGAIFLSGKGILLEIEDAVFAENRSEGVGGALAIIAGGDGTVRRCRFEGNGAEHGGAIYLRGEKGASLKLSLQECSFSANRARKSGGAIYGASHTDLRARSCRWEANVSEDKGGAIVAIGKDDGLAELELQDCKFAANLSSNRGGAVLAGRCSTLSCDSCSFDANASEKDCGGAVDMAGKEAESPTRGAFRQTSFSENRSQKDGGAVCMDRNAQARFESCRFEANHSLEGSGGAVAVPSEGGIASGEAMFFQCHFNRNRCRLDGGAMNASSCARVLLNECRFKNNEAEGRGGAFWAIGEGDGETPFEIAFQKVVLVENRSRECGGAIHVMEYVRLNADNCIFEKNRSEGGGGAVRIDGKSPERYAEAKFGKSKFLENLAAGEGGSLFVSSFSRVKVEECRFRGNQSERRGGCIFIQGKSARSSSEIAFVQATFSENQSKEDGGSLYIDAYSLVLLQKSKFEGNHCNGNGGAVALSGKQDGPSRLNMRQVLLGENRCKMDGGAINASFHTRMVFEDCTFHANSADGNCGAFGIVGEPGSPPSKVKFHKATFTGNRCGIDGGAVAGGLHSQMILEECEFLENRAEGSCGGLGLAGNDSENLSEATLRAVTFGENQCMVDGGAMVLGRYSRTKFENCHWRGNCAQEKTGGAILLLGKQDGFTPADFYDCTFVRNQCAIDGGAINANIFTQSYFERCRFEENSSREKNGGAMVLLGNDGQNHTRATFRQVVFAKNTCLISGGAINANDYTRTLFVECLFEENRAALKNGGAVLVLGEDGRYPSEVIFQESVFRKNECKGAGGAVNANAYTISSFEGCRFEMNTAGENGGGIFIRGLRRMPNKAAIQKCEFAGNIAGKVGPDVAMKGVKGISPESLVRENSFEILAPNFQAEDEDA